jgi:uncharacterized protein YndB with AHSA1/START domain
MSATTEERPSLHLSRTFATTPERVWRAWTQAEAMKHWIAPSASGAGSVIATELDVRVGGSFHIAFTADNGERHDAHGVYQEVDAPRKLSFTWYWKSTPERESLVTISLKAVPGGTGFDFVHERFFDAAARDRHVGGWNIWFDSLERHLCAAV